MRELLLVLLMYKLTYPNAIKFIHSAIDKFQLGIAAYSCLESFPQKKIQLWNLSFFL